MTTREEVLNEAPVGLTVDILTAHLQRASTVFDTANPAEVAAGVLAMLTGSDDARGAFDRYDVKVLTTPAGVSMVVWYCPVCDYTGTVIRLTDRVRVALTLGEIIGAVLDHEAESH